MVRPAFFCALLVLGASSAVRAEVRVTMHDGRVTVVAKDATLRQIFTEWARVGQAKVVNVERIPGGPISLQLTDVPEAQALEILLRSVSGYMAAPRTTPVASLARYDRIMIMPTPVAARPNAAPARPAAPAAPPAFQPPPQGDDSPDDETPPNTVPPVRSPVFTFPQTQVVNPAQQGGAQVVVPGINGVASPDAPGTAPVPALFPGAPTMPNGLPVGSAVPGVIVAPPAPPQPGLPGQRPQQ